MDSRLKSEKIYILCFAVTVLDKLRSLYRSGAVGRQNLWDAPDFLGAHILPRQRQKAIVAIGFQSNK